MTAIYTANRTWTAGEIVTAAIMNTYVRDNLDWFKTPIASRVGAPTSDFTTTSTTLVDITGVTATMTTNGGGLDIWFMAAFGASVAAQVGYTLVIDGVSQGQIAFHGITGSTDIKTIPLVFHVVAISAGSHTFKLQAKTNTGTLTVYGSASTTVTQFYVIERGG